MLQRYWPLILILLAASFLLFTRTSAYDFWDWDECIITEEAKEMKETGNFLTSQWNHRLLFEKPPLNNWLLLALTGGSIAEAHARAVMIFLSLITVTFVYIFSKKYFSGRVALLASLLLLTAQLYVTYTVRVNTDIGFTLFTFIGFFLWVLSAQKRSLSLFSGIFFGLAVMNKGLSITPFLLAAFLSVFLESRKEKLANFFIMSGGFLLTIIPWHLYQLLTHGNQFFQVYIIEHLIRRARYPLDFHFEGRLFYFKLIYKNFFPWIFFIFVLPLSYLLKIKKFLTMRAVKDELSRNSIIFTIVLFIVIPLFSITNVQTKIAWYALPIYPFIAIFMAYNIDLLLKKVNPRKIFFVIVIILAIQAYGLLIKETSAKNPHSVGARNGIFIAARKYPHREVEYLVQFSERRARETLAPHLQTSTTFYFGGNPCAVFYSEKKVHYYYSIPDFQKSFSQKKGLFVIENGDLWVIKGKKVNILRQNSDFTLFTN